MDLAHTRSGVLTDKQHDRLRKLFATEEYIEVQAVWGNLPADDRRLPRIRPVQDPRADAGRDRVDQPAALTELIILGWILKKRAVDVPAYFDRPRTSTGLAETVNNHLHGLALGFGNLTRYIAHTLFGTDGFRTQPHPGL